MWAYSMLGWYETREVIVELPESLTKNFETPAKADDSEQETPTMGY